MKTFLPFIFLLLALTDCKNKEAELSEISSLVGKWKLVAYEVPKGEAKVWEAVDPSQTDHLSIRADGVMLDKDGLPRCCAPGSYNLNGALFEVKPDASLPVNTTCFYVDCASCATWDIAQKGDEIIITGCNGTSNTKYVRE